MEILEVMLYTNADDEYIRNVINYPIKGKEVFAKGYGVTPYDTDSAITQFKSVAEYWNNDTKTPLFHNVISFTNDTASTVERAMELTEKILEPVLNNHLTLIGVHDKEHGSSELHVHEVYSPTNIYDGSMMHADNSTLYPLAQRVADVTGQQCRLVVKPEDREKKEFHRVFFPHKNHKD